MNLMNTPMRVFKEARRKGDTETMERAMGYVGDFYDKAEDYKAEADKGMEEDAREAREKAKLQCEEAIQKRREEREKLEAQIEENRNADTNTDTVEISEEGKQQAEAAVQHSSAAADSTNHTQDVTYDKSGEAAEAVEAIGENVNVSV